MLTGTELIHLNEEKEQLPIFSHIHILCCKKNFEFFKFSSKREWKYKTYLAVSQVQGYFLRLLQQSAIRAKTNRENNYKSHGSNLNHMFLMGEEMERVPVANIPSGVWTGSIWGWTNERRIEQCHQLWWKQGYTED